MTGADYCKATEKLGLGVNAAARFLRIGRTTSYRWEIEGTPAPVEILLKLMIAMDLKPETVTWLVDQTEI